MKKKLALLGLSVLSLSALASCGESSGGSTTDDTALTGVTFESENVTYDGNSHEITVKNLPSDYRVEYSGNAQSEIGNHLVKATIYKNDTVVKKMGAELTIDCENNKEFDNYLVDLFKSFMGYDFSIWNQLIKDPSKIGYVRPADYVPSVGGYITTTDEDIERAKTEAKTFKADYEKFSKYQLSIAQRNDLNYLEDLYKKTECNAEVSRYSEFYDLSYVNTTGGIVSNTLSTVKDMDFFDVQDITDTLAYLSSLDDALPSFLDYMSDAVSFNLALADDTIDGMIEYLKDIYEQGSSYYIYDVLNNKIDGCDFISNEEKTSYKDQFTTVLNNEVMPSLESFSTEIAKYKGHLTNAKSIHDLNEIKGDALKWYENNLKANLGNYDITVDEYAAEILDFLKSETEEIDDVIASFQRANKSSQAKFQSYLAGESIIGLTDPTKIMEFLKEFAKTMVPDLASDADIEFEYMDPAFAKTTNIAAYYSLSALDATVTEHVTINGETVTDNNELLTTLAHEGYPGHLYQHVYLKESNNISYFSILFRNLTVSEGWATYVENKILEYLAGVDNNMGKKLYCDYTRHSSNASYCLYAYGDYLVNYKGATKAEVANFMNYYGFNGDVAESLMEMEIEFPLSYEPYAYGRYIMLNNHANAKNQLGDLYNEVDYNDYMLPFGNVTTSRLKDITNDFIEKVKVLNGNF